MAFGMNILWNDGSNDTAILTSFIVSSAFALLYLGWRVKKPKQAQPPGPRGLPLLGYLPFLGTQLHKAFAELAGVYGPIFKLRLGNKLCVVVTSPSLVKEVVRDLDITFANRDPSTATVVASLGANDIAFNSYGPEWKKLRRIFVSNMMSKATLDASYTLRKQEIKKAIRGVYDSQIGKPLEVGELSISTSISLMKNMLWGGTLESGEDKETNNLGAELRLKLAEVMVLLGKPNISDIFPVLSRFDIQGIAARTEKITEWFEEIISSAVEQYRRNKVSVIEGAAGNDNEGKKDFLQLLLELKENGDSSSSISMTQFRALLLDVIVGGTDTTTTTVEWTMTELLQHPQIMKKVQDELAEAVGLDSCVEEFHLPNLTYLDAVVKESLRLHPAFPLLVPRRSREPCSIGGYAIPKGTTLMVNIWAIHRDPQLWDDPLEFKPERFLNGAMKFDYLGNNFQYLPFGSGRRMCAGISLGERMLMFVLASLLHSFDWKLPTGTELDVSETFGLVIKKKEPLIAIPSPRLTIPELY